MKKLITNKVIEDVKKLKIQEILNKYPDNFYIHVAILEEYYETNPIELVEYYHELGMEKETIIDYIPLAREKIELHLQNLGD